MEKLIRKILKEESLKDTIKQEIEDNGFESAAMYVGGIKNLVSILYGGDLKAFFKDNDIEPYHITSLEPNLYISDIIVQSLGLSDAPFSKGREKNLGKFSWVSGGIRYRFTAYLRRTEFASGKIEWRVVGQSGDSGFGYSFISQRNTLGKRARMQIFNQIIDTYNLDSFK
jgi:hypothetical protein